jgi:hypothetical protein
VKTMDEKRLGELRAPPKTDTGASEKGGAMELSRRTGISERTIRDYLKLLDLEPDVQAAVQYTSLKPDLENSSAKSKKQEDSLRQEILERNIDVPPLERLSLL